MKAKIYNTLVGLCCSAAALVNTGCIEEVFPTSAATEDQLAASDMATEALLWGVPSSLNVYGTISSSYHFDWGYGSMMHIRDVMTGDMPVVASGYDWFSGWEEVEGQGEDNLYPQYIWNYYWSAVLSANKLIAAINPEQATVAQLGYLGVGHAFRAMFYLDMAQMFEYLPNPNFPAGYPTDGVNTAGNNVTNLTVPIVRENITEAESRHNPRVSREDMLAFILEDLDAAEQYMPSLTQASASNTELRSKALPHLDVVYGLKARAYLWTGDYAKAAEYAQLAIQNSGLYPMSEDDCLNTTTGFNDISKWMFGSQMVSEDNVVQTSLLNWASWMCNEATFGYSAQEPNLMIDVNMYNRMSDTDFRKKMWKAPEGTALYGETPFIDGTGDRLVDYASVKFRPAAGNTDDFNVGAATAYPLMRVEEMYFILAEALAHTQEAQGRQILNEFMVNYRDPEYVCNLTGDELIDEIIFQKRVELWGEGLSFFDIKRLNMSVTRGYIGTNFRDATRFNTVGRPAWMNFAIVRTEKENNEALMGYENPDPSQRYELWKDPTEEEEGGGEETPAE